MQTRRRLLQQDTVGVGEESETLISQLSVQQLQNQQKQHQLQLNNHSSFINIGDNKIQVPTESDDDKYKKAERQWNFRTITSKLQTTSGKALHNYIQQPLSTAAAALVPGYYQNTLCTINDKGDLYVEKSLSEQESNNQLDKDIFEETHIVVMASRNRTGEFNNAVRSLQSRNISQAVNIRDPRKAKQVQSYSEFMMVAKLIGKNIASTYAKLEKLTILAKRKTLFDDRPQEIQELTYIIKGDLNALNKQIGKLQEICKDQRRTINGKHLVSHSSNMVLALQSKLANMSSDFKQILEIRSENLKHQKTRRDQFVQSPSTVNTISPFVAKKGSLLLNEENQSVTIDMSSVSDTPSQQQIAIYDDSDRYVQERAETMQNIESTIVELGGIFQQLAYMVKEQEEIVERIDTNVQDAELNIEAAHSEILKYFQTISKNRWLMIKIFGVLIFFFIFFIIFMT